MAKDKDGAWQEINDQHRMEEACKAEKKARLSQATKAKTPYMHQHLLEEFSYIAVRRKAKEVLRGEYIPSL